MRLNAQTVQKKHTITNALFFLMLLSVATGRRQRYRDASRDFLPVVVPVLPVVVVLLLSRLSSSSSSSLLALFSRSLSLSLRVLSSTLLVHCTLVGLDVELC